jgi:hypothetical protein
MPDREPRLSGRYERVLLLGLFALNAAVGLWLFSAALTEIPCTGDESSVYFQAQTFAGFHAAARAPERPELFASHYLAVKDGRWFSIYPPVYPLLLALGMLFLGGPMIAVALMSSASIVLVYLVVRDAYQDRVLAGVASTLLFLSPSFRFYSSSYYTHVGSLLAVLVCLRLLQTARPDGDRRAWLGAGLAAAIAAGIRPFESFWILLPVGVWAAAGLRSLPNPSRRRALLSAGVLAAAAVAAAAAFNASLTGDWLRSPYLEVVNSGGRLAVFRNLSLASVARLWEMFADAAKWTLACGYFVSGNLKDGGLKDINLSIVLVGAGVLAAAWESRSGRLTPRFQRLFLAMLACATLGHLFYFKKGGPYGERRLFEAGFLLCLFPARLLLRMLGQPKSRAVAAVLFATLGAGAAFYLPNTIARVRQLNERRLQLFLTLRELGVHRGLVYVEGCPDFDASFCLRNRPDLTDNVFVLAGRDEEGIARAFPGRRRYVFRFKWSKGEYVLEPYESAGVHMAPRLYTVGAVLRAL